MPPPNLNTRNKFKFYHISWNINNFFIQCCQENWELCSPEMDGPKGSKLMLVLKRATISNDSISCLVRRPASDSGPETVWANFDLGFFSKYVNHPSFIMNRLYSFNKGSEYETTFQTNFAASQRLCNELFMSNWFYVRCGMIIYIEGETPGLEEYVDVGLKSLSEDMLALYQSSLEYDIELKVGDSSVQAHKAILCSRWPYMKNMINNHETGKNLDLSNVFCDSDFDTLKTIMSVIYTGDVKYALEKPSLAIREKATKMDIPEVQKYYCEERLFFQSTIHSREFIFKWSIRDFNSVLESNKYLVSPVFTDYDSNRTWKLHFYSENFDNEDYVAISVETNEEIKSANIWLEISAFDRDGDLTLINILRRHVDCCKMIRFQALAYRNWIRTCAVNDVLSIVIKLQLSSGRQRKTFRKHFIHSESDSWTNIPNILLSVDLKDLLYQGLYSDITVETESFDFYIHNCILAARCKGLYDMLMNSNEDIRVIDEDTRSDILAFVLGYIYTGSIVLMKDDFTTFEIGKLAKDLHFPRVKEICSKFLSKFLKKAKGTKNAAA